MTHYLKIRCGNCRGVFNCYDKQVDENTPAKCPFCNTKIPADRWRNLVNCFRSIANWNKGKPDAPMFTAEIRYHFVPRDRMVDEMEDDS